MSGITIVVALEGEDVNATPLGALGRFEGFLKSIPAVRDFLGEHEDGVRYVVGDDEPLPERGADGRPRPMLTFPLNDAVYEHFVELRREGGAVRNTRVPGHGLLREGHAFEAAAPDPWRPVPYMGRAFRYTGEAEGRGVCSCGDCSEVLPSTAARKRWHEEHKAQVRANREETT